MKGAGKDGPEVYPSGALWSLFLLPPVHGYLLTFPEEPQYPPPIPAEKPVLN